MTLRFIPPIYVNAILANMLAKVVLTEWVIGGMISLNKSIILPPIQSY